MAVKRIYSARRDSQKSLMREREYGFYWYSWLWNILHPVYVFLCALVIVLGVIFALVTLTTEFKFAPVLSVLGFGLAFGLYVNNRIIMFEEMINHITGMTERDNVFAVVILIFVLLFVGAVAGVIASFAADKETAK